VTRPQGRHFLQIPGPSPVPDRVLRAMDMPVIDHRSAEFAELGHAVIEGSQKIFKTAGPVIIYPSSGTGAWEAAIVNTLSPGDKVLMVETGHFATLWRQMAARWGIEVDFLAGDWRRAVDPAAIGAHITVTSNGVPLTVSTATADGGMTAGDITVVAAGPKVTITPTATWPASATIVVKVDLTAADLLGDKLPMDRSGSFTTAAK